MSANRSLDHLYTSISSPNVPKLRKHKTTAPQATQNKKANSPPLLELNLFTHHRVDSTPPVAVDKPKQQPTPFFLLNPQMVPT